MKLAITFPVYITNKDHLYFTEQTLESIQTQHEVKIFAIINYVSEEFKDSINQLLKRFDADIINNNYGNNVAAAWNLGIKSAFASSIDYVLIPNNDIIMHSKCIDNLIKFIGETRDKFVLWTAVEHASLRTLKTTEPGDSFDKHPGFSFFAVSRDGINKMIKAEEDAQEPEPGFFDPNYIAAYFEDQDMHQRILKAGFDAGKTASALYYHFGSRTIAMDDALNQKNSSTYEHNRRYFEKKWGYDSHGRGWSNDERLQHGYKTAFNK